MTFTSLDCALIRVRGREDPWNAIASGFATSGLLSIRNGPRAALGSAVFGGLILALIEGLGVAIGRATAPPAQGLPPPETPLGGAAGAAGAAGEGGEAPSMLGGMFSSIFGGGDDAKKRGEGAKQEGGEGLREFAPPPLPDFGARPAAG